MADDKHVTLTLEEADELRGLCSFVLRRCSKNMNLLQLAALERLSDSLRERWLDALRKESA